MFVYAMCVCVCVCVFVGVFIPLCECAKSKNFSDCFLPSTLFEKISFAVVLDACSRMAIPQSCVYSPISTSHLAGVTDVLQIICFNRQIICFT